MHPLGTWVIRITAAAMVCGTICALVGDRSAKNAVRLVCGVFLALTVIQPLTGFSLPDPGALLDDYLAQGQSAAALGENWAERERLACIKTELETYILDKAAARGATPEVLVAVDSRGCPVSVEIAGAVPEPVRRELERLITEDLGIAREDQKWTSLTGKNP